MCAVFGTGQIGTFAIRALGEAGWSVAAADKAPAASFVRRFGRHDGLLRTVDVTDEAAVTAFLQEIGSVDAVVFAAGLTGQKAASDPDHALHVLVEGVRNVASAMAARHISRLVAVSSLAVYDMPGNPNQPIAETAPTTGPIGSYGTIIRSMERALEAHDGLSIAILRTAGVFGPNRIDHGSHSSQLVERLLYSAAQRAPVRLRGDWNDCDDIIYARDVGRALAAAAQPAGPGCEIINVGTARTTTLRDLVRAIEAVAGPVDIVLEPRPDSEPAMTRPPLETGRMIERFGAARYDLTAAIRDFARETDLIPEPQG